MNKRILFSFYLILGFFTLLQSQISKDTFNENKNSENHHLEQGIKNTPQVVWSESFDYPNGSLPPGWVQTGTNHNWSVKFEALEFYYNPVLSGFSRVTSPSIDITGYEHLHFTFDAGIFKVNQGGSSLTGVDVSFNGGATWFAAWNMIVNQGLAKKDFEYFFTVPSGATSMLVSARYNGYSGDLINLQLDNFKFVSVVGDNLFAKSLRGKPGPNVGTENTYSLKVQNLGFNQQSTYTVKLMREGGVEIGSLTGLPISYGQIINYDFEWIPSAEDIGPTYLYGVIELENDMVPENNQSEQFNLLVQPELVESVEIGDGYFPTSLPLHFGFPHGVTQTIYYQAEIGISSGAITGLRWENSFRHGENDVDLQIWLGETSTTSLQHNWVNPVNFLKVYEGPTDFPSGNNNIFIEFDQPYIYQGGNLVVYTNKSFEHTSPGKNFINDDIPFSYRTRRAFGSEPFNPMAPYSIGASVHLYPNISFYFLTSGLGALQGNVFDDKDPLSNVEVKITGTNLVTYTDSSGNYSFPNIVPGNYEIAYSKFGFIPHTIPDLEISGGDTIIQNLELFPIPQYTVSGVVQSNDGSLLEGVEISLIGYDDYFVLSGENGQFVFDEVYQGTYTLRVYSELHEVYIDPEFEVNDHVDTGTITLTELIHIPQNLFIDIDNHGEGNAFLVWSDVLNREYRWDDGIAIGQIGAVEGTLNSVIGSVHRHKALVEEISWFLTDIGGPHNTVKLWVFGLDENGMPNRHDILYQVNHIPNIDNQWNNYVLDAPVNAPNGFLIGVSYDGFVALGRDTGFDPEWPFQTNTHFFNANITSQGFSAIETITSFHNNFMIRAFGVDYGELEYEDLMVHKVDSLNNAGLVDGQLMERKIISGHPPFTKRNHSIASRSFSGYNVYLNDMNNPIAESIEEREYLFTDLEEGNYTAGVQSVYTTGTSEIVTLDFDIIFGVPATVSVTTNTSESAQGAIVSLVNQEYSQYAYISTIGTNNQVSFPSVRKGIYTISISKPGFHPYSTEDLEIQESYSYSAELIENIVTPFGLLLEPGINGNALFSWNNIIADELFEDFEGEFPPSGWSKLNPDGGTGWMHLSTGTTPLPGWQDGEADAAPDGGERMAYVSWLQGGQTSNDQWFITPQLMAADEFEFSFYLRYWPNTFNDQVDIRLSTTGNSTPSQFNIMMGTLFFHEQSSTNWHHYSFKITDFVEPGTLVYVAFREHVANNSVAGAAIMLDNVYYGPETRENKFSKVPDSNVSFHSQRDYTYVPTLKTEKALLGYNVYFNGNLVVEHLQQTQHSFSNLPSGNHTFGVQSVYTSGVSDIVEIEFYIENEEYESFPVTFTVTDQKEIYQALRIKGEMTFPQWMDISLEENPMHIWSVTLEVTPGTFKWGITEDDGTENGQWLLPEDYHLEFTLDETGNVSGITDYILQYTSVDTPGVIPFYVYPNPAKNILNLSSELEIKELKMIDSMGRIVYHTFPSSLSYSLNVSSIKNGIYFVKVTTEQGISLVKVQIDK